MLSRIPLLLALLLASPAAAHAADTWTYAASEHFEVYTTGGDRRAREALTYFERVHAFFAEFLEFSPPTSTRTRLIVFSGDKQFAPYRPNEFATAFYQAGPDRDHIVMASLDDEAYPIVVHEYAHLIIRHSPGVFPVWLNEGLAEFFSTLEPEGDRMGIGKVPEGRLAYIREGIGMMELEQLFAVGHSSPEYRTRSHAGTFYSQSWALTHMLLTDDRYRERTGAFLQLVETGTPSADALMKAYGLSPEHVGSDLVNYVRQSQYLYFRVPYTAPPSVKDLPTRRIEPFEADLVTADLLSNMRERQADARAVYDRLAAERPDDLRVLEGRAYLEIRHGEAALALPYLRRAVEQGSRAAFVYRNLAMLDRDRAAELLPRIIELVPGDVEARLHYATLLLNADRTEEAAATLASAVAVPQDRRFALFQLLATAYIRLDRLEDGRAAADLALQYAQPGGEEEFAKTLIVSIAELARARALAAQEARRIEAAIAAGEAPPVADPPAVPSGARLEPTPFTPASTGRRETMVVVRGRMQNMVCADGKPPIIEVATADVGLLRLVIDDGRAVTVLGPEGGTIDLHCGAQDAAVRVGYLPAIGADTAGRVRLLDYRPE